MEIKIQETLRIVKFVGEDGIQASEKLAEIASFFKTSNRRTLQFCLAECYAVQSLPKPPRFFCKTKATETIFLPFSPKGLEIYDFVRKSLKVSYTCLAYKAIDKIHRDMKNGRDFEKDSTFFQTYIGTIYNQEIDI